jgi:sugar phosphate isomerase/epimerase
MIDVFCSTGGTKGSSIDAAHFLISNGISNIELSGGIYEPECVHEIKKLTTAGVKVMLHNYYPVPKESFVLNIASRDSNILDKSLAFLHKSIARASEIGSFRFAVHAGFLVDPSPELLGKPFELYPITKKEQALEIFSKSLHILNRVARSYNVQLYVENNVISSANFLKYNQDIFLMTSHEDFKILFEEFNDDIKLLLDVGHLKVSSTTLGKDLKNELEVSNNFTSAYHLHDNYGFNDDHLIFDMETVWFKNSLISNPDFITLEVHEFKNPELPRLIQNIQKIFQ